jgi:hypothetical protein
MKYKNKDQEETATLTKRSPESFYKSKHFKGYPEKVQMVPKCVNDNAYRQLQS